jgi:hypothetical protein
METPIGATRTHTAPPSVVAGAAGCRAGALAQASPTAIRAARIARSGEVSE